MNPNFPAERFQVQSQIAHEVALQTNTFVDNPGRKLTIGERFPTNTDEIVLDFFETTLRLQSVHLSRFGFVHAAPTKCPLVKDRELPPLPYRILIRNFPVSCPDFRGRGFAVFGSPYSAVLPIRTVETTALLRKRLTSVTDKLKDNFEDVAEFIESSTVVANHILSDRRVNVAFSQLDDNDLEERFEKLLALEVLQREFQKIDSSERKEFEKEALRRTHLAKVSS